MLPDLEEKVVKLASERPPHIHGEVHDELLQLVESELAVAQCCLKVSTGLGCNADGGAQAR